MSMLNEYNKLTESKNRILSSQVKNSPSHIVSRLQVADEVEIISDNSLLHRYTHVWRNPHWFDAVQTLYPSPPLSTNLKNIDTDKNNINSQERMQDNHRPSSQQLDGAKLIQDALIHFELEIEKPQDSTGLHSSNKHRVSDDYSSISLKLNKSCSIPLVSAALVDICCRLLNATNNPTTCMHPYRPCLQAIIETRQFIAFLAPDEVCLLKSPRSLRNILWKKGLQFASIFGHSSDHRSTINLHTEDLHSLSDARANFPGCVRWRTIIEAGGLSDRVRRSWDRMRDFLIFRGTNEVTAFLVLFMSELSRRNKDCETINPIESYSELKSQSLADPIHFLTQIQPIQSLSHQTDSLTISDIFDPSSTKRLLANFSFKGAVIAIPQIIWNTPIDHQCFSVRFRCALTPAAQSQLTKGAELLVGDSYLKVKFSLSQDTLEAWKPIIGRDGREFELPKHIEDNEPDILYELKRLSPIYHYIKLKKDNDNIVSIQLAYNIQDQPLEILPENRKSLDKISNNISSNCFVDHLKESDSLNSTAIVLYKHSLPICSKAIQTTTTSQPSISPTLSIKSGYLGTSLSGLQMNFSTQKRFKTIDIKRRVRPPPTLVMCNKQKLNHSLKPLLITTPLTELCPLSDSRQKDQINTSTDLLVTHQTRYDILPFLHTSIRQAIITIHGKFICFIGTFPFAPLIESIHIHDVNQIHHHISSFIDYFIFSACTPYHTFQLLQNILDSTKFRSIFWLAHYLQTQSSTHLSQTIKQTLSGHLSQQTSLLNQQMQQDKNPFQHKSQILHISATIPLLSYVIPLYQYQMHNIDFLAKESMSETKSRSTFFLVFDQITADVVGPLSQDPQSRVLLTGDSRHLYNWLCKMEEKQKRWIIAAKQKLLQHANHQLNTLNTSYTCIPSISDQCPKFQIHVLCILPYYITETDTYDPIKITYELKKHSYWDYIQQNLMYLDHLKHQFIYTSPLDTLLNQSTNLKHTETSRLLVWILPFNYIQECYTFGKLDSGSLLQRYALQYNMMLDRFEPIYLSSTVNQPQFRMVSSTDITVPVVDPNETSAISVTQHTSELPCELATSYHTQKLNKEQNMINVYDYPIDETTMFTPPQLKDQSHLMHTASPLLELTTNHYNDFSTISSCKKKRHRLQHFKEQVAQAVIDLTEHHPSTSRLSSYSPQEDPVVNKDLCNTNNDTVFHHTPNTSTFKQVYSYHQTPFIELPLEGSSRRSKRQFHYKKQRLEEHDDFIWY